MCQKEPILATWSNFEIGGVPKRAYFGYLEQFFFASGAKESLFWLPGAILTLVVGENRAYFCYRGNFEIGGGPK